jgi:branched-chain amino acid transport system ATP-binding protein
MLLAARGARHETTWPARGCTDLRPVPGAQEVLAVHPAGKLSGGQKQMLAVARAIVEPRALILVDEPSKGLAPAIIQNLITAFRELKASRTTVLLVEQNFMMARALGDTWP